MEKSRPEILSEIQETLAGLKTRIAEIERKLAELEQASEEPAHIEVIEEPEPIYVEPPVITAVPEPVEDVVEEEPVQEPQVIEIVEEPEPIYVEPPVITTVARSKVPAVEEDMSPIDISIDEEEFEEPAVAPAPVAAPKAEEGPAGGLLDDGEPVAPKASINDRQERRAKKTVMDVMGQKLAWKSAIPGTPVKNVISAISLNDRVLFINTLFKEDPMAFQDAIAAFNGMSSFAEAEEYVRTNHPEWNLNSDLVFRLMMAVRRKLK